MLRRLKAFIRTSLLGGVTVILPIAILAVVFNWIFRFVTGFIKPLTTLIVNYAPIPIRELIAQGIAVAVILVSCFLIGVLVRTGFGRWIHEVFEDRILKIAPGYQLIKETILQLLDTKRGAFSKMALVDLFNNGVLAPAFIMDQTAGGMIAVYIPTVPTPTGGFVYYAPKHLVYPLNISTEEAMRVIISCGAGSCKLLEKYLDDPRSRES